MKWIALYIILLLPFCGYGQVYYTDLDNAAAALKHNDFNKYHYWIQEAEKDYKNNPNFCGNGQEDYRHYVIRLDAIHKDKIGNTTEAIHALLPIALNRGMVCEDYIAITTLKTILLRRYKPAEIKQEVINALNKIAVDTNDNTRYAITLFGTTQKLYPMSALHYYAYKHRIKPEKVPDNIAYSLLGGIAPITEALPYMKTYIKDTYFYKAMMAD